MVALRAAAVALSLALPPLGSATNGQVWPLTKVILDNAVNGAKNRACICNGTLSTFSRNVDYFPYKTAVSVAKFFTVSYHGFYKIITNKAVTPNVVHVGYQCGAPKPTVAELGFTPDAFIELPVTRVGVLSTTDIPWMEYLGDREAIKAAPRRSDVSSSCLQLLMDSSAAKDAATNTKTVLDAAKVEVTFCSAGWGCTGLDKAPSATPAPVGANKETSVLATAAWVEYIGAYLNREQAAKDVVKQVDDMFKCHKARAASAVASPKPKVLWAMWSDYPGYESWNVPSCPNYYCELVEAAGGELLMFPTAPAKDNTAFFNIAKQADIWLYTSTNWDKLAAGTAAGQTTTNIMADLQQVPAVKNKKVFDFQKNGQYDWFESRMAEPDVVLEDLIAIITPSAAGGHTRVWWRDIYAGEKVGTNAAGCGDTAAPLKLKADACGSTTKPQAPRQTARASTAACVMETIEASGGLSLAPLPAATLAGIAVAVALLPASA